jgi:putative peptidoglycan lipid II flippase
MSIITKFKQLLSRSSEGGVRSATIIIAGFTFMSQVVGLIRDRLLAGQIGPGPILDSYYAAFKIPDLVYTIAGTMVSVTILLPFLTKTLMGDSDDDNRPEGRRLLGMLSKVYGLFFLVIGCVLVIIMPQLVAMFYPGFTPEAIDRTAQLARIMMLSPLFFIIGNMFSVVTQYSKRFVIYALSPVIYNAGIVLGILILYPRMGPAGLAIGVVLGAYVQIILHTKTIIRENLVPNMFAKIDWRRVREIFSISAPRTIGIIATSISSVIILSFASRYGDAAISRLSLALVVANTPLALLGVSYATAVFPDLVSAATRNDKKELSRLLLKAVSDVILLALPVMVIGYVLRVYGVNVLLGSGSFTPYDAMLVGSTFGILVLSLPASSLDNIALRVYYAMGQTYKPMWRNVVTTISTAIITAGLIFVDKTHPGFFVSFYNFLSVPKTRESMIVLIALGYTLSMYVGMALLWIPLLRKDFTTIIKGFVHVMVRAITIALFGGIISYVVLNAARSHWSSFGFMDSAICTVLSGMLGVVAAFVLWKILEKVSGKQTFD